MTDGMATEPRTSRPARPSTARLGGAATPHLPDTVTGLPVPTILFTLGAIVIGILTIQDRLPDAPIDAGGTILWVLSLAIPIVKSPHPGGVLPAPPRRVVARTGPWRSAPACSPSARSCTWPPGISRTGSIRSCHRRGPALAEPALDRHAGGHLGHRDPCPRLHGAWTRGGTSVRGPARDASLVGPDRGGGARRVPASAWPSSARSRPTSRISTFVAIYLLACSAS